MSCWLKYSLYINETTCYVLCMLVKCFHVSGYYMFFSCIALFNSLAKVRDFEIPAQVYSASLLVKENVFVCGGEDFKMYKFDFMDGTELGTNSTTIEDVC